MVSEYRGHIAIIKKIRQSSSTLLSMEKPLTLIPMILACLTVFAETKTISLAGEWKFALGENAPLNDTITLPSTTDISQKGDGKLNGTVVERIHPQLVGADMMQQLTSHPLRRHPYVGIARYCRTITIPESWRGKTVKLTLERTKIVRAFLDGVYLGRSESLATPAIFEFPRGTAPGAHQLLLEVDNRIDNLPVSGHQVSDDTQTNWNGILGIIKLSSHEENEIVRVDVFSDAENRKARFRAIVREGKNLSTNWIEKTYPPSTPKWSEFTPHLITEEIAVGKLKYSVKFGLRDFSVKGTQFAVNGRKTFLRGRHDACVWPLTGAAPMEKEGWKKYFDSLKLYGLNHVRFHSWCPPEAAFAAADEAGVYLQPEFAAFGSNWDSNEALRKYCLEESKRILDTYGNHPSFVMFSLANEPMNGLEVRQEIIRQLRAYDPRPLYAQGSNSNFTNPAVTAGDDFWCSYRSCKGAEGNMRGSYAHADAPLGGVQLPGGGTMRDLSSAVKHSPIPLIGHETGQYQAYPNYREIEKYTGVLKPVNLEIFRSRLERAGMLHLADAFHRASGALMAINYREDIEQALRTRGFAGFQLLDLQDFPGQGTALVGLLDAFLDDKGFIKPELWRNFCQPSVLLARFKSYTWTEGETFKARFQIAHYGEKDIENARFTWHLGDDTGSLPLSAAAGEVSDIGEISITLPQVTQAKKLSLSISIDGTDIKNSYPLWLYPGKLSLPEDTVESIDSLEEAERLFRQDRKVLCILKSANLPSNSVPGFFTADFWNWQMFKHVCTAMGKPVAPGTLGLLINDRHPALADFPTSFHSDYQWRELMFNGANIVLDNDPEAKIIVQGIDNVTRNHRLGVIWEKRSGLGHLIVSAIDLNKNTSLPEAKQLKYSLRKYLQQSK